MKQLEEKVIAYNERNRLFGAGDHVLVACSGGADSMALLAFFRQQRERFGIEVSAVHVDHMLRAQESAEDRRFVERVCREWDIPFYSTAIPIPAILEKQGGNKQQVCRDERYRFFGQVMASCGATKLALAHHGDDQLETVLLAAVRGAWMEGIGGMPVRRPFGAGELIRPLLAVSKQEIADYTAHRRVPFREDPSNAEPLYTRNRLRSEVIPLLKKENAELASQAARFAEEMQEQQLFLDELAKQHAQLLLQPENGGFTVSARAFQQIAPALQKRVVLLLLKYLFETGSVAFTKQLVEQVQQAMHHSAGTVFIHLPEGGRMVRRYDSVSFRRQGVEDGEAPDWEISLTGVSPAPIGGRRYRAVLLGEEGQTEEGAWFFAAPAAARVVARSRRAGDRILLPGMKQPKKVARLMIDEKVPLPERSNWPVIALEGGDILLIPGLRPSVRLSRERRPGDNWALFEQMV